MCVLPYGGDGGWGGCPTAPPFVGLWVCGGWVPSHPPPPKWLGNARTVCHFALYKYAPVSERPQVLFPSSFCDSGAWGRGGGRCYGAEGVADAGCHHRIRSLTEGPHSRQAPQTPTRRPTTRRSRGPGACPDRRACPAMRRGHGPTGGRGGRRQRRRGGHCGGGDGGGRAHGGRGHGSRSMTRPM